MIKYTHPAKHIKPRLEKIRSQSELIKFMNQQGFYRLENNIWEYQHKPFAGVKVTIRKFDGKYQI